MPDPDYCKLYVDSDEEIGRLQSALDEACADIFDGVPVECPAFKNENFDINSRTKVPYNFIECSRYYVELGAIAPITEQLSAFQSGVAAVVERLREGGRFVTASCVFEDVIAAATGWNWTKWDPEPPGRTITA